MKKNTQEKKNTTNMTTKQKVFSQDNPFNRFMSKAGTLILANIVFLIGCLPIITIGTSLAALNKVMLDFRKHEDVNVIAIFIKAYRENLLYGIMGLFLGSGILSMSAAGIFFAMSQAPNVIVLFIAFVICGIMLFISLCFITFYFAIIAKFKNTLIDNLKNGVIIGVTYVRWGVLIWLLWAISIGLFLIIPSLITLLGFLWGMFGFSLLTYVSTAIYERVFWLVNGRETTDEY